MAPLLLHGFTFVELAGYCTKKNEKNKTVLLTARVSEAIAGPRRISATPVLQSNLRSATLTFVPPKP